MAVANRPIWSTARSAPRRSLATGQAVQRGRSFPMAVLGRYHNPVQIRDPLTDRHRIISARVVLWMSEVGSIAEAGWRANSGHSVADRNSAAAGSISTQTGQSGRIACARFALDVSHYRSFADTAMTRILSVRASPLYCDRPCHSITSSARSRIDGGNVIPSALAVFRLTTRRNLLACSNGNSAGRAPLRILSI